MRLLLETTKRKCNRPRPMLLYRVANKKRLNDSTTTDVFRPAELKQTPQDQTHLRGDKMFYAKMFNASQSSKKGEQFISYSASDNGLDIREVTKSKAIIYVQLWNHSIIMTVINVVDKQRAISGPERVFAGCSPKQK